MNAPGFRDTITAKRTGGYDPDGRALWQVAEDLLFFSASMSLWRLVSAGFVTNYASVPRLPIIYEWCGDRVYEPPALHDLGYTPHGLLVATLDENWRVLASEVRPFKREQIFIRGELRKHEAFLASKLGGVIISTVGAVLGHLWPKWEWAENSP